MQEDRILSRWISTALRSSGCSERNSSRVVWKKHRKITKGSLDYGYCATLVQVSSIQREGVSLMCECSYSFTLFKQPFSPLPSLSVPETAAVLPVCSWVRERRRLPWIRTLPASRSALCSSVGPPPTSPLTSAAAEEPEVLARTVGHWILQRRHTGQSNATHRYDCIQGICLNDHTRLHIQYK